MAARALRGARLARRTEHDAAVLAHRHRVDQGVLGAEVKQQAIGAMLVERQREHTAEGAGALLQTDVEHVGGSRSDSS